MAKRFRDKTFKFRMTHEDRLAAESAGYDPCSEQGMAVAMVHTMMRNCHVVVGDHEALEAVFRASPKRMREAWVKKKAKELS